MTQNKMSGFGEKGSSAGLAEGLGRGLEEGCKNIKK